MCEETVVLSFLFMGTGNLDLSYTIWSFTRAFRIEVSMGIVL